MLNRSYPGSNTFNGTGCQFRVHDRGQGRIALEALDGSGFVTVTGAGLSADVRLMQKETEGASSCGRICYGDNVCYYP